MISIILALIYPVAVQFNRGGFWRIVAPVTVIALVLDVICNFTELTVIFWDVPRAGELTFSSRLERLIQRDDWRGSAARIAAKYCNYFSKGHIHGIA